jgi:hypothetical protein
MLDDTERRTMKSGFQSDFPTDGCYYFLQNLQQTRGALH